MDDVQFYNAGKFPVDIPARRSNARPKSRRLLRFEGLERRDLLSGYSLWSSSATPQDPAAPDSSAVEVGVVFSPADTTPTVTGESTAPGATNVTTTGVTATFGELRLDC